MVTDLNKTLGYYQPFEWNQIPPTPIVSYPAAYPALSRRDYFILATLQATLPKIVCDLDLDFMKVPANIVKFVDKLLEEADKTP